MDPNTFQTFTKALLNRTGRQQRQVTTTNLVVVERVGEVRNLRQGGQKFQQQSLLLDRFMRKAG